MKQLKSRTPVQCIYNHTYVMVGNGHNCNRKDVFFDLICFNFLTFSESNESLLMYNVLS